MTITIIKNIYNLKVSYKIDNAICLLRLTEDNQIIVEPPLHWLK